MPSNTRKSTVGGVRLILAGLFIIKAIPKLLGSPSEFGQLERFRYPDWFWIITGIVELVAAVMLLAPRTTGYAVTALGTVMMGATFTLIDAGDFRQALVPMVI